MNGTSTLRVLADWANAYADWEEGLQCSPSADDLVRLYEERIGQLAVDPREAFYAKQCEGTSLEELVHFLAECEHVQPHQPATRYEVIQVNGRQMWTVLKWEDDHCVGGDHHWLIEATAHRAADLYRRGAVDHGAPEELVLRHM